MPVGSFIGLPRFSPLMLVRNLDDICKCSYWADNSAWLYCDCFYHSCDRLSFFSSNLDWHCIQTALCSRLRSVCGVVNLCPFCHSLQCYLQIGLIGSAVNVSTRSLCLFLFPCSVCIYDVQTSQIRFCFHKTSVCIFQSSWPDWNFLIRYRRVCLRSLI